VDKLWGPCSTPGCGPMSIVARQPVNGSWPSDVLRARDAALSHAGAGTQLRLSGALSEDAEPSLLPSQCAIVPGASRPRTPPAAIVIRPPRPEIHSRERNETRTGRFAPGSPPIRHGSCKGASRAKQHEPGVWASTVVSVSLRHIRHFTAAIVQLNATLGPHMPDANLQLQTSTTARVAVGIYSDSARGADGNFTHPLPLFSICRHPATFARLGSMTAPTV
jgi:hypothetical protein